jgi:hypothetical protein
MPTVLRYPNGHGRTRIEIYTDDHRPSHVHVNGVDAEAVLLLNCRETDDEAHGPVEVREFDGYRLSELNDLLAFVEKHIKVICARWRETHGAF